MSWAKEASRMPQVSSSAVDRVDYTAESRTLDIWYTGGDRYSYFDVPPQVYSALLSPESIGSFVNERIKPHARCEHEYRRRRLTPPCPHRPARCRPLAALALPATVVSVVG